MTIQEKRTNIENKLVGAETLYRIFNHTHYFLCGCASIGLFPVFNDPDTRMIVVVGSIFFAMIAKFLSKLFNAVKEDSESELKTLNDLNKWVFNNN